MSHNFIPLPLCLFLASVLSGVSSADALTVKATDSRITYMGRTMVTPHESVRFNYPGVTAMLNFSGPSLQMHTNPGSGYWMVEVDSLPPQKMFVAPTDSILKVASDLDNGTHSARITYCIEGFEFNPEIKAFSISDNGRILDAPGKGNLKIEFIGNSITCGFGIEAPDASCPFSYDTENHTLGYAYLTARALNADFNMVCRSGIGIYRNYNGPKEGNLSQTMPMEYSCTMLYHPESPWDFSRFIPDIVCINLGTNDTSCNNYDIGIFRERYNKFVDRLRAYYPDAKIVLLSGAMLNGKELELVKKALDDVASGRDNVYRFDMSPQDGSLGYGAGAHPSAKQAQKMASELTGFLSSLL